MEKIKLGQTDILITPILIGTWQAGKKMWVGIEDKESIQALRAGFEAGITTVGLIRRQFMGRDIQKVLSHRRDLMLEIR